MDPGASLFPYELDVGQAFQDGKQAAISIGAARGEVGGSAGKMVGSRHAAYGSVKRLAAITAVHYHRGAESVTRRVEHGFYKPLHVFHRPLGRGVVYSKPEGGFASGELTDSEVAHIFFRFQGARHLRDYGDGCNHFSVSHKYYKV